MTFKIGDQVMLRHSHFYAQGANWIADRTHRRAHLQSLTHGEYKLSLPQLKNIHPVFHVSLLEPFYSRDANLRHRVPFSLIKEDDWEIDAILVRPV
jgi:hypothetical protein